MSKNTFINTRFWQDAYVSELDPIEKLLFNYCLTSSYITLSGIYEIPLKIIAVETGVDKEMLPKIFARFEKAKKIIYRDGWLCVINYPKYQSYNKTTMVVALKREISLIPNVLLEVFIGYGYPINTLSIGYLDMDMDKDMERDMAPPKRRVLLPKKNLPYTPEYENFWKLYPKKVGKKDTFPYWKKLSTEEHQLILRDVPERIKDEKWRAGYIKDPIRYIKSRQWEDEIKPLKEFLELK